MASRTRSVWEMRFRAIKQQVFYEIEWLKYRVANKALAGTLTDEDRDSEIIRRDVLNKLNSRIKELEELAPNRIYLIE